MINVLVCIDDSKVLKYNHKSLLEKGEVYYCETDIPGLTGQVRVLRKVDPAANAKMKAAWSKIARVEDDNGNFICHTKPFLCLAERFKPL